MAAGTLRIGVAVSAPFWEECVVNNGTNPCPDCKKNEKCGGILFQFFKFSVAPILNMKPVFVECKGFGLNEGRDSVLNKLKRNEIDISSPASAITTTRSAVLPSEYPLLFQNYVAVMKRPATMLKPIVNEIGTDIFHLLLAIFASYVMVEALEYLFVNQGKKKHRKSIIPRELFHFWPFAVHGIVVAATYAYFGSAVTLTLQATPKFIPRFKNFTDLAHKVELKQMNIIVLYPSVLSQLFPGPNVTKSRWGEAFSRANLKNPAKILQLHHAVELINQDPSNVLLLMGKAEKQQIDQDHCKSLHMVEDPDNTLPRTISSFYYSPLFFKKYKKIHHDQGLFDAYAKNVLPFDYKNAVSSYTWNASNDCGLAQSTKTFRVLGLEQFNSLFYSAGLVAVACCIFLVMEKLVKGTKECE